MGYFLEPRWLVSLPRLGGSNGLTLPFRGKTYTFHAQDVYVSRSKRIRFTRDTYTLRPGREYVTAKGLVLLVLVMLVKMETRLERAGEVGGN